MTAAFDTLAAARDLESAGMDRKQAEAVAGAIRAGQGDLATRADLAALESRVTATLYRALWIQAAAIIAAIAALAGIAIGPARALGGTP